MAPGGYFFRRSGDAIQLGDVVKFGWEMIRAASGESAAAGVEFVILDVDGRIRTSYQFIER